MFVLNFCVSIIGISNRVEIKKFQLQFQLKARNAQVVVYLTFAMQLKIVVKAGYLTYSVATIFTDVVIHLF